MNTVVMVADYNLHLLAGKFSPHWFHFIPPTDITSIWKLKMSLKNGNNPAAAINLDLSYCFIMINLNLLIGKGVNCNYSGNMNTTVWCILVMFKWIPFQLLHYRGNKAEMRVWSPRRPCSSVKANSLFLSNPLLLSHSMAGHSVLCTKAQMIGSHSVVAAPLPWLKGGSNRGPDLDWEKLK